MMPTTRLPTGRTAPLAQVRVHVLTTPAAQSQALLTPAQVAQQLQGGKTKIYQLMASGQLASVRIGRCRRIPVDAVTRLLAELQDQPASS